MFGIIKLLRHLIGFDFLGAETWHPVFEGEVLLGSLKTQLVVEPVVHGPAPLLDGAHLSALVDQLQLLVQVFHATLPTLETYH